MAIYKFTLSSGATIELSAITGKVVDNQHSSTTSVYSSGGGGYLGPQGGYVAPVSVESVTNTKQSIWIQDANGIDHEIRFRNQEVPVRVGQKITAYWSEPRDLKKTRLIGLHNHGSQRYSEWLKDLNLTSLKPRRSYIGWKIPVFVIITGALMMQVSGHFQSKYPLIFKLPQEFASIKECDPLVNKSYSTPQVSGITSNDKNIRKSQLAACINRLPNKKIGDLSYGEFMKNSVAKYDTNLEIRYGFLQLIKDSGKYAIFGILGLCFADLVFRRNKIRSEYVEKLKTIIKTGQFS